MAYQTGSANSYADILAAIVSVTTANGWTWDATNGVLSKGGLYFQLTTTSSYLRVLGGTGGGGGSPLSGYPYRWCAISNTSRTTIAFPATYYVHLHPTQDQVFVMLNYASVYWQWLLLGRASNFGYPGSGAYYGAALPRDFDGYYIPPGQGSQTNMVPATLEMDSTGSGNGSSPPNFVMLDQLDYTQWSGGELSQANAIIRAWPECSQQIASQPNQWNQEIVLLPVRFVKARGSSLYSLIGEIDQIRFTRNTYLNDGDVITLGTEKWKVYPAYSKNASVPDGSLETPTGSPGHSGTYAIAVRYDGP